MDKLQHLILLSNYSKIQKYSSFVEQVSSSRDVLRVQHPVDRVADRVRDVQLHRRVQGTRPAHRDRAQVGVAGCCLYPRFCSSGKHFENIYFCYKRNYCTHYNGIKTSIVYKFSLSSANQFVCKHLQCFCDFFAAAICRVCSQSIKLFITFIYSCCEWLMFRLKV
jgi:hypothetical protein